MTNAMSKHNRQNQSDTACLLPTAGVELQDFDQQFDESFIFLRFKKKSIDSLRIAS